MKITFHYCLFFTFILNFLNISNANNKRVRYEIRDISNEQRNRIFNAMDIMKHTSMEEGKLKYGDLFVSYDTLVSKHMDASASKSCDQAHLGPAFATFHRIFILEFEKCLMTIDQNILSLPYWDYNLDIKNKDKDPRDSIIWSDEYFGSSEGELLMNNAVLNGRFGHWKILHGNKTVMNISKHISPYGYLRSEWNNNSSPHITRHRYSCGSETTFGTTDNNKDIDLWNICLNRKTYITWYLCLDPSIHTWAHSFIGGIWNTNKNTSRIKCYIENAINVPNNYKKNKISCFCDNTENCFCDNKAKNMKLSSIPTYGDFADTWASPNDPIFFFHHANIDRHLMIWQHKIRNFTINNKNEDDDYYDYGFPKLSIPCYGHGLDDVISSNWPFNSNLVFRKDMNISEQYLTNRDVITLDGIDKKSPYTYDKLF